MESKRNRIRCKPSGKRIFASPQQARMFAATLSTIQTPYRCPHCGLTHLTTDREATLGKMLREARS